MTLTEFETFVDKILEVLSKWQLKATKSKIKGPDTSVITLERKSKEL